MISERTRDLREVGARQEISERTRDLREDLII
jgi:hypothetical protein